MKKIKMIKLVSLAVFWLTIALLVTHMVMQVIYVPKKKVLLLNEQESVYQNGDLSKSIFSSGEARQFFFDFIDENMDLDYKVMATAKNYSIRLDGNGKKDIPDYRDIIKPYFTEKGYKEFISALESSPMLRNFWNDGKWIRSVIPTPPQSSDLSYNEGKVNPATKRLEYSYVGSFYSTVYGRNEREVRYKIEYAAKLIRVPAVPSENPSMHYFKPLVPENYSGMKIDSFSWDIGG
tara:strand:- start:12549 stop:13253 length:705 start_codon:yes stop_codon:yes gene_type:complete